MRVLAVVLTVLVTGFYSGQVDGQVQKFPYQAVVVEDDVLVRSGGNDDYYPTQRLKRDMIVTVHRQDPGGWLAIAPPDGSFSWIPAQYVKRSGKGTGVVTEDHIIIFVGSEFGDEASVWQQKATSGTSVKILGERELETPAGPRSMYRIAPPTRERRWIVGSSVVPVDEGTRKEHDRDPFELPSGAARKPSRTKPESVAAPAPSARLQRIRQIRAEQRQLAEIDQRFRKMLRGNPTSWDLEGLEDEYNQLRERVTWRPVAGQIDMRFPAIDRYRQRKAAYEDFQRLTSETERRDAALLASQFGGNDASTQVAGDRSQTVESRRR